MISTALMHLFVRRLIVQYLQFYTTSEGIPSLLVILFFFLILFFLYKSGLSSDYEPDQKQSLEPTPRNRFTMKFCCFVRLGDGDQWLEFDVVVITYSVCPKWTRCNGADAPITDILSGFDLFR